MTEHIVGTGILNWNRHERISDRYGFVHLYEDVIPLDGSPGPEPTYIALRKTQGTGQLLARVLTTRESQHIGDFFRGLRPSTPKVGEEILLGHGQVRFDGNEVGLAPLDKREIDWLDPRALYRCHEQTVTLVFIPDEEGATLWPPSNISAP